MDGQSLSNGREPQVKAQHPPRGRFMRIPTVNDALPFTPFSSIVPFNPDLITPPLALPSTTPTAFGRSDNIEATRRELARLTSGDQTVETASKRQQTLKDVEKLLDAGGLTQFKFKMTKRTKKDIATEPPPQPELSTFANMVYEKTKVDFRYLTPKSKSPEKKSVVNSNPVSQQVPVVQAQSHRTSDRGASPSPQLRDGVGQPEKNTPSAQQHPRLAQVQTHSHRTLPSAQLQNSVIRNQNITPSSSQHLSPHQTPKAFVISASLTPAQRAEYQKVPESSPIVTDLVSLKNHAAYLSNSVRMAGLDQRNVANQAVELLQSLLQEIFTAEDQLQPDTSGDVSRHANNFFVLHDAKGGSVPVLQANVQTRLDIAFQKVANYNRLDDIEVAQLGRVQRLCENSIAAVGSASLHIGEDWTEQDTHEWLARIETAQNGLVAARTLMRIMIYSSHHNELQSEDHLRAVLDAVRAVVERCIIPVVEERPFIGEKIRGEKALPRNPKFDLAVEHCKTLQIILHIAKKTLAVLGTLFVRTDVDETRLSGAEYLCKSLIFAENGATEKDSALGIKAFEDLRRSAMDVLGRIFTKYTGQREYIIDEILLSLEKLPATKQSARQFTLIDAKPIQLVSALLMRLVQTSATPNRRALRLGEEEYDGEDGEAESEMDDSENDSDDSDTITVSRKKKGLHSNSQQRAHDLSSVYTPLRDDAQKHANYIAKILLTRAMATSKSSTDEPFRKLLDIFTDDFLNVLSSSDWPAAELLLRTLATRMVGLAENTSRSSPAPARTLALELLGVIGTGILDVQSSAVAAAKAIEMDDPVSEHLYNIVERTERGDTDTADLTAFEGPYRVVAEYLHARNVDNDPQLQSARGYHLVQWADSVCGTQGITTSASADLQNKIRSMIEDPRWQDNHSQFPRPTTVQGKLAAKIVAANSRLCKAFNRIFNVILQSMSSELPTVRSRSLKSVTTLLEKDPSILNRNPQVLSQIVRCLGDQSPLVRESALGLVQKCVALKPEVELKVYERVIARTGDAAVNVRKRSMVFLKQVYLRNSDNQVRAAISNALIARIKDSEESVAEAAQTTIEEVWFSPFRELASHSNRSVDMELQLHSHAALIIQTVELSDDIASILEDLIKNLLTKSKHATDNVRICKTLVGALSEGFLSTDDNPGALDQSKFLRAMAVFAKAAPKLFTARQLENLSVYTQNITTNDDLDIYHFAITILRYTLPVTQGLGDEFLTNLLAALLKSVSRIPKSELGVVAPCCWTINTILGGPDRLQRLITSALISVYDARSSVFSSDQEMNKISKVLTIVGQFGKACDFEQHLDSLKASERFSWFKGSSVAALMVEICCKFTSPKQPTVVRKAALEAVCEVCQTHPDLFLRADITNAIETVFKAQDAALESILLSSLEAFFAVQDISADEQEILGTGIESGTRRLGNTYQATSYDSASASLSQRFLSQFLRIALSSLDEASVFAARIVVYINERGMAHPSESAPGLTALETCPNSAIAKLAFVAHKEQYGKHENVFEKTLVRAVQQAFEYQQRVAQSTIGFTGHPPASKLHFLWEVIKGGKTKVRTKLFTQMCSSMDFDPIKLDTSDQLRQHLLFVRFCVENIAFFEYDRVEDLMHLLSCLEKTFAGTGTSVAQAIESEILKLYIPASQTLDSHGITSAVVPHSNAMIDVPAFDAVDQNRLRQLAGCAQMLSIMWETRSFLRRLWNLQKHAAKPKNAKKDARETSKGPTRAANASGLIEAYQNKISALMASSSTVEAQRGLCSAFVELMTVDNEVKVASDDDDALMLEDFDDARSEGSSSKSKSPGPSRGKKRKSIDAAGGPIKKKGRTSKSSVTKVTDDDGWV